MRMWLAMLAGAVVLVGCGVFFALQDLGRADQYASVASFFLGLVTAIGSVLALARTKPKGQQADPSRQNQPPTRGATFNFLRNNGVVVQGDRSRVNVTRTVEVPSRKGSRRVGPSGPGTPRPRT